MKKLENNDLKKVDGGKKTKTTRAKNVVKGVGSAAKKSSPKAVKKSTPPQERLTKIPKQRLTKRKK